MTEWISVEDRLPEGEKGVLVFDGDCIEVGFMDNGNWIVDYLIYATVTHWMPLPEKPIDADNQTGPKTP